MSRVHVCSFEEVHVTRRMPYEEFRANALRAGRFSIWEASETQWRGALFTRLCRDPEVETFDLGFPWTGVRARKAVQP